MQEVFAPLRARAEPQHATRAGSTRNQVVTFREAALRYRGDPRFLPPLIRYFGDIRLPQITQAMIDQAAATLYPGASPATWERHVHGVVSAILKQAGDSRTIKRPRYTKSARLRWIWPDASIRLATKCWSHFLPTYLLLQHTGAHPAEALFLEWSQINLARRRVYFPATVSADERYVPLSPLVAAALERLPHRHGVVCRRLDGEPYKKTNRAAAAVKTAFAAACRRAEIRDYSLRNVRATWGLWHFAVNRNLDLLMLRGGWRDHRMLARYKSVSAAELDGVREALRALDWDIYLAEESWGELDV